MYTVVQIESPEEGHEGFQVFDGGELLMTFYWHQDGKGTLKETAFEAIPVRFEQMGLEGSDEVVTQAKELFP